MKDKKTDFKLNSGRYIHLLRFNQWYTYEGLIEGLPTKRMNQAEKERSKRMAKEAWEINSFLIEPTEEPIQTHRPYPFGEPVAIPRITCMGLFRSFDPVGDAEYSMLTIIWFQNEFAFPIEDSALAQLLAVPWNTNATDYDDW